jgi:ribosomal protein S18 acetylase RimI-like enzyme
MVVQIRDFTYKDMPNLIRLLNETYKDSYEFSPIIEGTIRFQIEERGAKFLIAEENNEICGAVAYRDGFWGEEIRWLAASENQERTLIEDMLVREIEKHVKREKVFTTLDEGSPRISEWNERGYRAEGGLYHMAATLKDTMPLPKVPEGVSIRSLKPEEEKELVEAGNKGFGWERLKLGALQEWKNDFPPFNEEWVQVAELEGKIVSIVVAKPDTYYNKLFSANRGYLGPAATIPECQGKSLASALTCKAMDFLFERGYDPVVLHTQEQNVPSVTLLKKLGFKIGHHWKFMRKNVIRQYS